MTLTSIRKSKFPKYINIELTLNSADMIASAGQDGTCRIWDVKT